MSRQLCRGYNKSIKGMFLEGNLESSISLGKKKIQLKRGWGSETNPYFFVWFQELPATLISKAFVHKTTCMCNICKSIVINHHLLCL